MRETKGRVVGGLNCNTCLSTFKNGLVDIGGLLVEWEEIKTNTSFMSIKSVLLFLLTSLFNSV